MIDRSYLSRVQRPSRYTGREINAVYKDSRAMALRVALLFPDLYEVGMSHLGLAILYDLLNQREDIWAERAYAPAPDLEAALRSAGQPLGSLESGTPLRVFDLVGVSLQYELGYTNVLTLLELGGIPLLAQERGPDDPVVVGGGSACFNPEPVAPFFDALVLGDGEEVILELAAAVQAWKASRGSRPELWRGLEALDGVYVPTLFEPEFDEAGRLREMRKLGRRDIISKRVLPDLEAVRLTPRPLVPFCRVIHDRLNVEIARGCTRGCRYCQAGMIYRPVRERDPAAVRDWVEEALAGTGFEEVSLLTLSPGDYQALPGLLPGLMDSLAPRRVALSLPSLRADTLTPEVMAQIRRVRRTGLTIAPEAASDHLRRLINKNLPEETILASARGAFAAGWQLLKLYFMIGLPRETDEDLQAIGTLAREILQTALPGRRPRLNISLSTFIPKAHTPFQWEAQAGLEESRRRLHQVKDSLRAKNLQVKWNSAAQSWLEGVFSRGDRRLARVLLQAHRRGCRLDAWSEHLRLEPWREAFEVAGVNPDFYLRERRVEEVLPWDHLSCGVSREFLLAERERAYQGEQTPDCRRAGCQDCGVCDQRTLAPRLYPDLEGAGPAHLPEASGSSQPVSFRLTYAKLDEARWLSHLELVSAFYRSLRRSGLPLAFTAGFHPLPRVAFHGALPVGVESLAEIMDVDLKELWAPDEMAARLNLVLPVGLRVLTAQSLPRSVKGPHLEAMVYQVESPEDIFSPGVASRFLQQQEVMVTRRRPGKEKAVDLRRLVARLEVVSPREVRLVTRLLPQDNLKVTEVLAGIFQVPEVQARDWHIIKLKNLEKGAVD